MEYLIGTGGWAYFQIPGIKSLEAYSRIYNFVEVNSTFYEIPSINQIEKWRNIVPEDFQFTVRAHRSITHQYKLQRTKENLKRLEEMKKICEILQAEILLLQTPASLEITKDVIENFCDLLSSMELNKLRIALEIRGTKVSTYPRELLKIMQEYNIINSVDLLKGELPAYKSDILYSRLFGKGEKNIYQPTDQELKEIDIRAKTGKFKKVVLSFHSQRMYRDAGRFKIYKRTGKFPSVTNATGLSSLREILKEGNIFPATKEQLIKHHGWKLFDYTQEKRVRAIVFLQKLPSKEFQNINQVIELLRSVSGENSGVTS
ncbi:hypothetical protein A3K80_00360 [Candidatus Bathyarchaeota archaeon RBG_13_38_9]|nr:MAG: hypothetical protein A3K80_00360 [Candidatus Bathyarchaeota archaeon RBG_13_38_9]